MASRPQHLNLGVLGGTPLKMDAVLALKLATVRFGAGLDPAVLLLSGWSKDPSTGNWISTYVVDNRLGKAVVNEVNVLVDSVQRNQDLQPRGHTEPNGWDFHVAVSGSSADPPLNEFGTFWSWHSDEGVAPGTMSPAFSLTWPWPWSEGMGPCGGNNYFLWSATPGAGSDGLVGYGNALAPDFGRGCPVT